MIGDKPDPVNAAPYGRHSCAVTNGYVSVDLQIRECRG